MKAATRVLSASLFATLAFASSHARAQVSGTASKPLPNVLLLVDSSGSMERMGNGTMPVCNPGSPTEPNRWGMLLQALTGNLQPFFSCEALSRSSTATPTPRFVREFGINGIAPYDTDYFLPYHRPMTGTGLDRCVVAPRRLPGAPPGAGVGPARLGAGGLATDFPDEALAFVSHSYLNAQLDSNGSIESGLGANSCLFAQSPDGQLDAARDYVRFALMTFDSETDQRQGVVGSLGVTPTAVVDTASPFLGNWSYLRSSANPLFTDPSNSPVVALPGPARYAVGNPLTIPPCAPTAQEVGARHEGAPPWEGRLVRFPDPHASLYDLQRQNEEVQRVLISSRPYGATPIDGMMDDAKDYLWWADNGPKNDPLGCRDKYIVLLTDGAPNLDLRPSCTGGPLTGPGATCPFPKTGAEIAHDLLTDSTAQRRVKTFVIGFSVNGSSAFPNDGFPSAIAPPNNNCKGWYESTSGGNNSPTQMKTTCDALYASNSLPAGSTADACCKLNEIALQGSDEGGGLNATGAFFAESQSDIQIAFGRILANIVRQASTRTVPASTPVASFDAASFTAGATTSAQFLASFIPNTQKPWSGEIDRTRYQCVSMAEQEQARDSTRGDFMSVNVAQQAGDQKRVILTVVGDKDGGGRLDSAASIRPFANQASSFTGADGVRHPDGVAVTYSGLEVKSMNDLSVPSGVTNSDWPKAFNIDQHTCRRSRVSCTQPAGPPDPQCLLGSKVVPALDDPIAGPRDCTDVVWGFATAYPGNISKSGTPSSAGSYEFNVRCSSSDSTTGKCSVSNNACTVGNSSDCPSGEVCVPGCAALGAIFHSNPAVLGPPVSFLREEGFRDYAARFNRTGPAPAPGPGIRARRRTVTFVATTDGFLHAFKSTDQGAPNSEHELWAFAPPAALPRMASNYPQGNQVILDGTPVVKESIWERAGTDQSGTASSRFWHTTLVAGLGGQGGGYYALNVTDADCNGTSCETAAGYQPPAKDVFGDVETGGYPGYGTTKRGPHFLWQLTDIPAAATENAKKIVRESPIHNGGARAKMAALFGKTTSTPAIGMVQIRRSAIEKQIGIAILPGGLPNPPARGATYNDRTCDRGAHPTSVDTALPPPRNRVRKWAADCNDPVAGRGVTIVRLDNGEIIRHFGRRTQDVPINVQGQTTDFNFDSPIVGTPVVFPDTPGVPIQKIFVGDADGTIWRIDTTNPDPAAWSVSLFQDLYSLSGNDGESGQPIQISPVVSTDNTGNVVLNVATGDQDSLVYNAAERNYVYSISEVRNGSNALVAKVNWYQPLLNGERVTGPMTVFDRALYFATFRPRPTDTGPSCGDAGAAQLWGFNYNTVGPSGIANGGLPAWCLEANVNPDGTCSAAPVPNEPRGPDLIPGVTLRTSSTCVATGSSTDELGGMSYTQVTPVQYSLSYGISRPGAAGSSSPSAARGTVKRPLPKNSTKIDSWSIVIE